ncbi:neuromedin-U receptor 1-like [Actinia tenebrosa]|uniref:Neuromedin-U receptor 1-like n=1 Tax=Actinia tenebrosa TaxID=6105 RepID=A0A6P8IR74_ACTTE|nr:neuromedin-U receptor 1-like [Actinia tenebrosa]
MENKDPKDEFLRQNSSVYSSQAINNTSREYVFAPVSYLIKLIILTAMLSFGVYGLIANSLILYFKHKQHRRRRHTIRRPFSRSLTEYFINSLALSDLLCCLISLPLYSSEMFIDFVKSDSVCRFTRLFNSMFAVITILNLLVIGVERHLTIFHPFFILSRRTAKKMVAAAWVLGVLFTLVSVPAYGLVYFEDIDKNYYTLVCKYDSSMPLYRALFITFISILYIVPSFILTFISLCILNRQRESQRADAFQNTRRALSRLKVTRMFVSLIFAFIIPYMAFSMYSSFRMVFKVNVSFTADYIVRHISVSLIYANGSISATILIYYEKLYNDFWSCFQSRSSTTNDQYNKTVQRKDPVYDENARKNRTSAV